MMPDGNPLVAQERDTTTVTGIGIAESAQGLASGISDGDWVEAGLGAADLSGDQWKRPRLSKKFE